MVTSTMESATGGAVVLNGGANRVRQFQDLFEVIPFTFTLEEDSIAASAASSRDITVTGAAFGDFVLIGGTSIDLVQLDISAFVQAADTVTINIQNLEANDVASTVLATAVTFNGLILKPRSAWGR